MYEVRINPFRDFIRRSRSSRFYVLSCNDSECAQNWTIFHDEFENSKIRDPFIPLCSKFKAKFMRKYQLEKPIVVQLRFKRLKNRKQVKIVDNSMKGGKLVNFLTLSPLPDLNFFFWSCFTKKSIEKYSCQIKKTE